MAEASQIDFPFKELTELMVRHQGIKEGHWMVLVRFSHTTGNLDTGKNDPAPGTVTRIESIGIQRIPEPTPISVDASELSRAKARSA